MGKVLGQLCVAIAATIVVLILLGMVPKARAAEWPVADMNRVIDQTNFRVNGKHCSGTLIDVSHRLFLTAGHCVKDEKSIEVSQPTFSGSRVVGRVVYTAEVLAVDTDVDLALLQAVTSLPNTEAAKVSCTNPVRGDRVYVVGNPLGLYGAVHVGVVSSVERDYGSIEFPGPERRQAPLMQVDAGILGGNSGGSVYNEQGELVGVPVLGNEAYPILGFAVPLSTINAFLKEHAPELACTSSEH